MAGKEINLNSVTRRDALKGFGAALGSTLMAQPAWAASTEPQGQKSDPSAASHGAHGQRNSRPNILYINCEGVPLGALSCYGSTLMETPNIDRLAREGMRFNNAFVTNALCAPSRATLMTGKYSHLNGMVANPGASPDACGGLDNHFNMSQETFAKELRSAGYQTSQAGKWHLLGTPLEAGFDSFFFKQGAGGPYYEASGYIQNPSPGSTIVEHTSYPGYTTDTIATRTINEIKRMAKSDAPFMMYYAPFNDHEPFVPPTKYQHIFDDHRFPEPGTFWDDYATRASPARDARQRIAYIVDYSLRKNRSQGLREEFTPVSDFPVRPANMTRRQIQQWNQQQFMRHYMGTLKALDDNIGRILDYLNHTGLSENTIVVLSSDHGFFMGDHGWYDKRFMYEQALRVPFMVRWPGVVKPGSETDAWTVNIDNAPTLLAMAGLDIPEQMQGESIIPLLEGRTPQGWRTSMYYHYYEFAAEHWVQPHYGIRTNHYKLIYYYQVNEWELFNLQYDPDEMDNLFEWRGFKVNPHYDSVTSDLVKQLKALRKQYKDNTGMPVNYLPPVDYD